MSDAFFEQFPALATLPVIHAFTTRVPGLDVAADRPVALGRLAGHHEQVRSSLGLGTRAFITAKQVHGAGVARVDATTVAPVMGVDALVTNDPRACLGIHVADCGPVFFVDAANGAIGCAHSGRKGTDLAIAAATIAKMREEFGTNPADLVVQLGPCIRPPHYEVDFATAILRQCREAGVRSVHDCATCTASAPERYYSYRREKGQTGRMLAILALK
jgi:polyphenol oxidase